MWTLMLRERIGIKCFGLERNKTGGDLHNITGGGAGRNPAVAFCDCIDRVSRASCLIATYMHVLPSCIGSVIVRNIYQVSKRVLTEQRMCVTCEHQTKSTHKGRQRVEEKGEF